MYLVGKPEGKRHMGYLGVDGMIILKFVSTKWHGTMVAGFMWLRKWANVSLF
jgi:hypothetical protein